MNNPVNLADEDGRLPSWAKKVIVGSTVIVAAAILTVATAGTGTALACFAVGALQGAVTGAALGAATGAVTGAITHRVSTGSWDGAGEAALNGAASGYMSGAISGFVAGGITSNVCFVAGTAVLVADGFAAIETIKKGDYVWATNPVTGERALKEVVQTFVNKADELIHVTVENEEIICTKEHPFYSPVKGWTSACKLRAGDILVNVNGKYVVVEKVQHEILETPVVVYNFEVLDFHTYYVSNSNILVHNLCVNQSNPGATGQAHHPISRSIENVASKNANLNGVVTRNGVGTIRANTLADHVGYQKWHRNFDNAVTSWLSKHDTATEKEFIVFMNKLYKSSVATSRFGTVTFG